MILPDSVPVWVLTGVVMAGGWLYERNTSDSISTTQEQVSIHTIQISRTEGDIAEIKSTLRRIEQYLLENR